MECRGHSRTATWPGRSRANPSFSANRKPCNHNGYRVFSMLIICCFPFSFPFTEIRSGIYPYMELIYCCIRSALSRFIFSET